MKKKFDLFGLKAYDEKVDNEDKDMNLQDQFYSQGVKHMKERRKSDKRDNIYLLSIALGFLLIMLVAVICSFVAPVEVQANAAEATTEETEINYYNYTLTFNKAPCHFYVPNASIVAVDYPIIDIFKSNYLYSSPISDTHEFMVMLYEVIDPNGVPFAREVLQVGMTNYSYIVTNNLYATNYNNIALTNTYLSANTNVSSIRLYNDQGRLYKPANISWNTNNNYRYKVKISVSVDEVLDLSNYKIRACSLVDYYSYPNNKDIWCDYSISNSTSSSSTVLTLVNASRSDTEAPTYSIAQSYDSYFNAGYNQGYSKGYTIGADEGYESGYDEGEDYGFDRGFALGEDQGFIQGVEEANEYSFLGLTTAVVDAPVKIFSSMFDFNVLGFNMTTFLFSIITLCLVFAVIKRLL